MMLRESPSGPFVELPDAGGAGVVVETLHAAAPQTALERVDASDLPSGTVAQVYSVGAAFELDRAPGPELAAGVDGVTVVQSIVTPPAVWTRRTPAGNRRFAFQPAWRVDVTGDDDAPGTPAAPLRTIGELCRRLYRARLPASVVVELGPGDFSAEPLELDLDLPSGVGLSVQGTVTSSADVLAAVLATTPGAATTNAGAVRGTVTATAAAFTDRQRLRITSGGALGGLAWVTRVPTPGVGGVANVTRWGRLANPLTSTVVTNLSPAAGASYALDTLDSRIGALDVRTRGPGRVTLLDLLVRPPGTTTWAHRATGDNGNGNGVQAYGCRFEAGATLLFLGGVWTLSCCQLGSDGIAGPSPGRIVVADGATMNLRMCVATGGPVSEQCQFFLQDGANVQHNTGFCFDGVQLIIQRGAMWDQIGSGGLDAQWVDVAQSHLAEIAQGGTWWAHSSGNRLWGLNNACTSSAFLVTGTLRYNDVPSAPGGTSDVSVGGTTTAYAGLPVLKTTFSGALAIVGN